MNAQQTTQIIEAAGGDAAFARLIGIDGEPGHQQRVNNWKRRGMPAAVELAHYAVIQKLKVAAGPKALPRPAQTGPGSREGSCSAEPTPAGAEPTAMNSEAA